MPKFLLIGGFLGAGKTTLIRTLAQTLVDDGQRVAIVTNDQTEDLVDTQNLRSQGLEVGEVAGACFCCSFDELLRTAESLGASSMPDVILAEPVGSCTDLVATVVLPLQRLYETQFDVLPFGVLLKPSHGLRILQNRSGFSPQAEYIFRKQLEEADYLMIGRRDQLSDEDSASLRAMLAQAAPEVPILSISPKTGEGVDQLIDLLFHGGLTQAGQRVLEIDYDTYAEGEAEMGWVNLAGTCQASEAVDLNRLAGEIVEGIRKRVLQRDGQIAHIKTAIMGDGIQAIANVVDPSLPVDEGLSATRPVSGPLQWVVNARVVMDPDALLNECDGAVHDAIASMDNVDDLQTTTRHALRPGRPEPVHRMQ